MTWRRCGLVDMPTAARGDRARSVANTDSTVPTEQMCFVVRITRINLISDFSPGRNNFLESRQLRYVITSNYNYCDSHNVLLNFFFSYWLFTINKVVISSTGHLKKLYNCIFSRWKSVFLTPGTGPIASYRLSGGGGGVKLWINKWKFKNTFK